MEIVYATDVHGNKEVYERLLAFGMEKVVQAVVIGGDTSPGFEPGGQRGFFKNYLVPRLGKFRKESGIPVLFIMGNDDYASNLDVIEDADKEGVLKLIHKKAVKVNGYHFAGYTCINPGPLFIRDWIRDEDAIRKDLEKLRTPEPRRTVYVFHAPPYNTKLDVVWSRQHVGSKAIREFIMEFQPLLALHGHIHESPQMTGRIKDILGKTAAINPGNGKVIAIDLETLEAIEA